MAGEVRPEIVALADSLLGVIDEARKHFGIVDQGDLVVLILQALVLRMDGLCDAVSGEEKSMN